MTLRIAHVSDLHFGKPCIPDVIDAMEAHLRAHTFDVVVVSGDVAQRSLSGEFQRAAALLRDTRARCPVLVVPGNHDVAWWMSPLHVFGSKALYTRYRRYVSQELEPTLHLPGATFAGINTAHGVAWATLTPRPRDVSIIGAVTAGQVERVRSTFAAADPRDARIIVMHHNPLRGTLSHRYGIARPKWVMEQFTGMGVDLVLSGHDHQEAIHHVTEGGGSLVVCTAGTLSNRSRAGRPCSFYTITVSAETIAVTTHMWSSAGGFEALPVQCYSRASRGAA